MITCTIIMAMVTCTNLPPASRRPTPQQAVAILTSSVPPFVSQPERPRGPRVIYVGNGLPTLGPWDDLAQKLRPAPFDWQQLDWFAPGLPLYSFGFPFAGPYVGPPAPPYFGPPPAQQPERGVR